MKSIFTLAFMIFATQTYAQGLIFENDVEAIKKTPPKVLSLHPSWYHDSEQGKIVKNPNGGLFHQSVPVRFGPNAQEASQVLNQESELDAELICKATFSVKDSSILATEVRRCVKFKLPEVESCLPQQHINLYGVMDIKLYPTSGCQPSAVIVYANRNLPYNYQDDLEIQEEMQKQWAEFTKRVQEQQNSNNSQQPKQIKDRVPGQAIDGDGSGSRQ